MDESVVVFEMPDAGSVSFSVTNYGEGSDFSDLSVSVAQRAADDHGDDADHATLLSGASGSVSGVIDAFGDEDWFTVDETVFMLGSAVQIYQSDGSSYYSSGFAIVDAGDTLYMSGYPRDYNMTYFSVSDAIDLTPGQVTTMTLAAGEEKIFAVNTAEGIGEFYGIFETDDTSYDWIYVSYYNAEGEEIYDQLTADLAYISVRAESGAGELTVSYPFLGTAGTAGNDTLSGSDGADTLQGLGGDDLIQGGKGRDVLYGTSGDNTLLGEGGADRIYGGSGHDLINGGAGADSLYGAGLSNTLDGGEGRDYLVAGDGGDMLIGGDGDDTLYGGVGVDTFVGGAGVDQYWDVGWDDLISFANAEEGVTLDFNANVFTGSAEGEGVWEFRNVETTDFADRLVVYNGEYFTRDGDDVVVAYGYSDTFISTGEGRDTVTLMSSDQQVRAGDGGDLIYAVGSYNARIAGNDGADVIYGGDGDVTIYGGRGADVIYLNGYGTNMVAGGGGNDRIHASSALDKMAGNGGADTFVFAYGTAANHQKDRIQDFKHGVDKIDLSAFMGGARFIDDAAFSGGYQGPELRYEGNKLYGDRDGDGSEDFTIVIVNESVLTQDDFLL